MQEPLNKLLPKFIADLEKRHRSPSTILAYRADLEQLISFLAQERKALPREMKTSDLEKFRDALLAEKYAPKSASRKLNAVKTFCRWLKEEGFLGEDPSEEVNHPKIEVSMPKFLSQLEYRALRDVCRSDDRCAAIVELMLQTGLRISEVANLRTEDAKEETLTVRAHATQPERKIPLNAPAKGALTTYLEVRTETDSPYVFISKSGNSLAIRNIRATIDRYMQKAQISDYSVNDLRTTFIVENLKGGVDLGFISKIVGHKRVSTTERYMELAGIAQPGKKQELAEL
ncbi:tyrosine-type recombinase/integrase [candidate division KSB1 bacterium]|nr:tyrosine-type recombinase/integrase [candidate division KSB1 bacterium]